MAYYFLPGGIFLSWLPDHLVSCPWQGLLRKRFPAYFFPNLLCVSVCQIYFKDWVSGGTIVKCIHHAFGLPQQRNSMIPRHFRKLFNIPGMSTQAGSGTLSAPESFGSQQQSRCLSLLQESSKRVLRPSGPSISHADMQTLLPASVLPRPASGCSRQALS
jgi:hypothetical protein